ncbi:MAG: N-acetylgalactosamine 6-sulfate sulfatase [Opitutia bacterium Tous-C1TDCM]|nr:MAG: N-acetylgalactosamine 6-sulfate sulfatase [Opitutae bacterium Tous-C1TDCM]
MKRCHRLALLALLGLAVVPAASLRAAASARPNLVVIMTDDHGYADVGFNGCPDIPTPHLDSIARRGVRFSSGYVTYSVCSPSRAGFITGRYPQRFGHERNPRFLPADRSAGLPLSETTLADTLGKIGYRNAIVGKWHLGAHPDLHPLQRGFHEFFGMLGGGHRYFPAEYTIRETAAAKSEADSYRLWLMRNHEPVPPSDQYLTDELSDAAVGFIARHRATPFFLYLAYNAPHTPLQATEKYLSRFANITDPKRRTYAAMVSAVDDGVGRVLAELRRLGLEENTLVFFLSDNGGPTTVNASRNTPLRGNKGDVWEGGFRVPFAAQWPARFPAGRTYGHPVSSLDIFATIAAVTAAPLDPARPLDGVNLLPFVTGAQSGAPHAAIYLRKFDQGAFAVRRGDFKIAIPKRGDAPLLFNLASDLGETKDLAAAESGIVAELEALRTAWNARLVAPVFAGLLDSPTAKKAPKAK